MYGGVCYTFNPLLSLTVAYSVGTVAQVADFDRFMGEAPTQHRIAIAGNHDIIFDAAYYEQKWNRFHKKKFEGFDNKAVTK